MALKYILTIRQNIMTYNRIFNTSNTTGATSGAGTVYSPKAHKKIIVLSGIRFAQYFVFCVLWTIVCLSILFPWPLYCLYFVLRLLIAALVSPSFLCYSYL